jgi:hypothetical protein
MWPKSQLRRRMSSGKKSRVPLGGSRSIFSLPPFFPCASCTTAALARPPALASAAMHSERLPAKTTLGAGGRRVLEASIGATRRIAPIDGRTVNAAEDDAPARHVRTMVEISTAKSTQPISLDATSKSDTQTLGIRAEKYPV